MCRFASYIAEAGLKHRTIKVYLSGIWFLHMAEGVGDPFTPAMLRLGYIPKGIKRCEAEKGHRKRKRLLISTSILRKIKSVWEAAPLTKDTYMLWASCCLAFFGFLQTGEMTCPSDTNYDSSCHLSMGDVARDDAKKPTLLRITPRLIRSVRVSSCS